VEVVLEVPGSQRSIADLVIGVSAVKMERVDQLTAVQRKGLRVAVHRLTHSQENGFPLELAIETREQRGGAVGHGGLIRWVQDDDDGSGWPVRWPAFTVAELKTGGIRGPWCPERWTDEFTGKTDDWCHRPAGAGTSHRGVGACSRHGGGRPFRRVEAGWVLAHGFAQELNVSPWEGLLWAVRIAAGKVAYCESVLAQAPDDLALEGRSGSGLQPDGVTQTGALVESPGRDWAWWVAKGELWHERLARISKMAIDAGVAERLVAEVSAEAHLVARVLTRTIESDDLGLTEAQLAQARGIMRRELLALDAPEVDEPGMMRTTGTGGGRTIEGDVSE